MVRSGRWGLEKLMRRREFISVIGGATAAWPLGALAQQAGPTRLIGVLMGFVESDPAGQSAVAALRSALTTLGWTEGSNLRIELRWGDGDPDMLRTFAKELVDLRPDALLGGSTAVTGALARETRTIPIVFTVVADPIGSGFVASLAHPGGNITGFTAVDPAMGGKWLELLKEIAPLTVRAALLFNPPGRRVHRPHPQRHQACRPSRASPDQVRAADQYEDR